MRNITLNSNHGQTRLATARNIVYKAFERLYAGGPGQVITLLASCSYQTSDWKIFFLTDGNGKYQLMEQMPRLPYNLITYYVADYTTGIGLEKPVSSVTIVDAQGEHEISVEPL